MAGRSSGGGGRARVQWEWSDHLCWSPYPASTSALIEAAFQAGQPSVHFSVAQANYAVRFQPLQPLQKNLATGRTRSVKRQASSEGNCASWLWWELESQTWHAYDDDLASQIEAAWKESCLGDSTGRRKAPAGLFLKIHGQSYNIEFEGDGVQYNLKTQFARGVRRNLSLHSESEAEVVSGAANSGTSQAIAHGHGPSLIVNSGSSQGFRHGYGPSSSNPSARSWSTPPSATVWANDALSSNVQPRASSLTSDDYENTGVPSYNSIDVLDFADPPDTEDCSICLSGLRENRAATLSKCKHSFHRECIQFWFRTRPSCPECLTVYGTILGTQPPGEMHIQYIANGYASLAGYPGLDVIKITYNFSSGIQTGEHPNPGKRYTGTTRTAFLPKNGDGEEVLELLKKAWRRRLLFRIGTSVTTGQNDVVIWAGIHHKTRTSGGSSHHGYPDDTYFVRVKKELEEVGVV